MLKQDSPVQAREGRNMIAHGEDLAALGAETVGLCPLNQP